MTEPTVQLFRHWIAGSIVIGLIAIAVWWFEIIQPSLTETFRLFMAMASKPGVIVAYLVYLGVSVAIAYYAGYRFYRRYSPMSKCKTCGEKAPKSVAGCSKCGAQMDALQAR